MKTMREVLATNESKSQEGITYDIIRSRDGVVYCECPGWRTSRARPRACRHLQKFHAEHGMEVGRG